MSLSYSQTNNIFVAKKHLLKEVLTSLLTTGLVIGGTGRNRERKPSISGFPLDGAIEFKSQRTVYFNAGID